MSRQPSHDAKAPEGRAQPSLFARLVAVVIATLLGLCVAEWGSGAIRGHAWRFLNIYEADAQYGVRLEANVTTATRSREGRVTEVRTNRQGFRGDDWTPATADAPVPGRVLLLGDSQMFGYGVDEADGVARRLEGELGPPWQVLNAAVPTWGPPEYALALEELGPRYRPEVVVFVANVANDWYEVRHDNRMRTTERNGWARHHASAAEEGLSFPGRRFLLGRSHLVHMVRSLWHHRQGPPPAEAVSAQRLSADLPRLLSRDGPYRSRLTRSVLRAQRACEPLGCAVVVAGLPLDVQVHAGEWDKYATPPLEAATLARLGALLEVLLPELRSHGLRTVDLTPPLRVGSPGAFLPDDYHLSPAGHLVVAQAMAATIRAERSVGAAPAVQARAEVTR